MKKILAMLLFVVTLSFSSFAGIVEENPVMKAEYKNKLEVEATAYSYKSDDITVLFFKKPVMITVHYNDLYRVGGSGTVTVDAVKINDDGVPVLNYTVNDTHDGELIDTGITARYYVEDGTFTDVKTSLATFSKGGTWSKTRILFGNADFLNDFKKKNIQSIEVWVHETLKSE